jgi:hypothetical protein
MWPPSAAEPGEQVMGTVGVFERAAWQQAKWAFLTRRVNRPDAVQLLDRTEDAIPGDLVLARIGQIGAHRRVQLTSGRPSELYAGDLIVGAVGARYAPDQFEGLAAIGRDGADLLAGGGVVGRMRSRNARISPPTRLVPVGLLADAAGLAINLARYALAPLPRTSTLTTIGVVGTSMNSGKTTAAASLVHGLARAGHQVAAIKATGTGACGDFNAYLDAGAHFVADFTDAGMATTYREPVDRIEAGLETMLGHAAAAGCEAAIVEIADGLFQRETAALLAQPGVRAAFDGIVFATSDAMGAAGGCAVLGSLGIRPSVLTGTVSLSPLGCAEARTATGLPVTPRGNLSDPAAASALLARLRARTNRPAGVPAQEAVIAA